MTTVEQGIGWGRRSTEVLTALLSQSKRWWVSLTASEQAKIKVVGLFSLVCVAFHYSLTSLTGTIGYDSPLAYIALVPLFSVVLAWMNRVPRNAEPYIHDRQLDYILGLPMMALALLACFILPAQMGLMYWFDRVDLLVLPVFVAGAVVLLFGTRAAWRQRLAISYLFLAWPWPYSHVLLGTLNGFTNVTLGGLEAVLKLVPVARTVPSTPGLFVVSYHGHSFPVSVVTACSGVDGMVGFLLVGVAFTGTVRGNLLRKAIWLALGLVLLWTTNLLRLLLIFWVGSVAGENLAINILHPVAGLVIFCIGVMLMALLLRPFGLKLVDPRLGQSLSLKPAEVRPGTQKIFAAVCVVAVAAFALCVNNSSLKTFNPVASAAGEPKLASFLADPASPAGWSVNFDTEYTINKPLFGGSSRWFRYIYSDVAPGKSPDLYSSLPVTADVINAAGLSGFNQYGVEACYTFHGYQLADVAKVDLGDGISGQALSYRGSSAATDWSIVYWIWPVTTGTGTRYERIILYLQNTEGATVRTKGPVPGISGISGALRASDPEQARLIQNRTFLVAFAREIVAGQLDKTDKTAVISQIPGVPSYDLTARPAGSFYQRLRSKISSTPVVHRTTGSER